MDQQQLLRDAEAFARAELSHDSSGHDWWHIDRVTRLARRIASEEGADVFLCALAALLHDIIRLLATKRPGSAGWASGSRAMAPARRLSPM